MDVVLNRCITMIGVWLVLSVTAAHAQDPLPELFKDIDSPQQLDTAKDRNALFMKEHLYFAKHHRLVEVDFGVLREGGGKFTITPFEGESITVTTNSIEVQPNNRLTAWRGEIVNDEVDLEAAPLSPEIKAMVRAQNQVSLLITIHNGKNTTRTEPRRPPLMAASPEAIERADNGLDQPLPIQTLSGRLQIPGPEGKTFQIFPLKKDPRYHVVLEVDHRKTFSGEAEQHKGKNRENREKYQQFLEGIRAEKKQAKQAEAQQ